MGTELLAMNWDEILSIENINEQWTIFKDITWKHGINMYLNEQVKR